MKTDKYTDLSVFIRVNRWLMSVNTPDRAEIVDPKDIPADVITMRSRVRLKDLVSGESNTYSLVCAS